MLGEVINVNLCQFTSDSYITIRYNNYLSPEVVQDLWSKQEDLAIVRGQSVVGNKWTHM
jgi:hypothetical protein